MADHGHASARGKMAGSQATREQQRGTIFEVSILNGTLLWPREADQLVPGLLRIWCVWFVFFVLLLFALGVFGLFCLFGYSSRSRRPSSALPDGPCELDGPCKVDGPCKLGSTALARSTALPSSWRTSTLAPATVGSWRRSRTSTSTQGTWTMAFVIAVAAIMLVFLIGLATGMKVFAGL